MTAAPEIAPHVLTEPATPTPLRPLLEVVKVTKRFPVRVGPFKREYVSAVDSLSFTVDAGRTIGIVGESGCGKSTAARLVVGLLPIDGGDVIFEGENVHGARQMHRLGPREMALRRNMHMVFQDPQSSLNPRSSVGEIIAFVRSHSARPLCQPGGHHED